MASEGGGSEASGWAARQLRLRAYRQLDSQGRDRPGLSPANKAVCGLILLSCLLAFLETEDSLVAGRESLFLLAEALLAAIFVVEYLLRLWIAPVSGRYGKGWRARLRYAATPAAIADLLAILPSLVLFAGSGADSFLLRLFRLLRILRLARLGRFSQACANIGAALRARSYELWLSVGIAGLLLVVSSTLLYLVEAEAQPEAFGSIPRAMWWSLATLTTVGYGDVVPVTPLGRIFAAFTAITGIGLIAMPAGILAAAFSDVMQRDRGEG